MSFPRTRMRRLRRSETLRRMARETRLSCDDLVLPLFAVEGSGVREPVASMPGVLRFSVDELADEVKRVADLGIPAVILFGVPARKDARGSGADAPDGVVQRAVESVRRAAPELVVITDVCLCEYTDHGHCGLVEDGEVRNDPTLERIAAAALSHARAGAHVVAPSDMMDGRVGRGRGRPRRRRLRGRRDPRLRRQVRERATTGRSGRPPRARRPSATAAPTRWIRRTGARRCARCASTWKRARTC